MTVFNEIVTALANEALTASLVVAAVSAVHLGIEKFREGLQIGRKPLMAYGASAFLAGVVLSASVFGCWPMP